jgi:hypothetical protein
MAIFGEAVIELADVLGIHIFERGFELHLKMLK